MKKNIYKTRKFPDMVKKFYANTVNFILEGLGVRVFPFPHMLLFFLALFILSRREISFTVFCCSGNIYVYM